MRTRILIIAFLLSAAATAQTVNQRLVVWLKSGDFAPSGTKVSVYDTADVILRNMETVGSPAVYLV